MKNSLTMKMFVLIFVSIILLFSFIAGFQYIYYLNFYEDSKIEETAKNLESYVENYTNGNWTLEEQLIQAKNFNIKNNATLYINHMSNFQSITEAIPVFEDKIIVSAIDSNSVYFDFYLDEDDYNIIFDSADFYDDPSIIVSGVVDSYQTLYPTTINATAINNSSVLPDTSKDYTGTLSVTDVYSLSNQAVIFSEQPMDTIIFDNLNIVEGKIGNIEYNVSALSNTSVKQVNFFYSQEKKDYEEMFFVNLSLQSVDESMMIYKKFLPLLLLTTIIIALVVSFIYSKQVSRPIVQITHVANDMSKLNFDKQLPSGRKDELGILSKSINTLSSSLNTSLKELSEANIKLQEDYDNEVKQELIRKNFVANVSHEIKTPLGIIKSYAEGIKDVVKKEKQDYYIDVIIDEIDRMDILLLELLELSKLDSGHVEYDMKPMSIEDTIIKLVKHHEYFLMQNQLKVDILGNFIIIEADSEKMYRAMNNLITNAIKYATPGSTIEITGRINETFSIEIKNDCEPLTEAQNEQIWHRFYKADESHTRDIEGNGLGLSIVKSIIEAHDFSCSSILTKTGIVFKIDTNKK